MILLCMSSPDNNLISIVPSVFILRNMLFLFDFENKKSGRPIEEWHHRVSLISTFSVLTTVYHKNSVDYSKTSAKI